MLKALFTFALGLVLTHAAWAQSPGTVLWEFVTTGRISSSPALDTNGTIYFGCNNRVFYALNPNGTKLAAIVFGVFAQGRFVRSASLG